MHVLVQIFTSLHGLFFEQDGEQQLQFCSDKCLSQYKMNIFCKETQEHLQSIHSQVEAGVLAKVSTFSRTACMFDLKSLQRQQDLWQTLSHCVSLIPRYRHTSCSSASPFHPNSHPSYHSLQIYVKEKDIYHQTMQALQH